MSFLGIDIHSLFIGLVVGFVLPFVLLTGALSFLWHKVKKLKNEVSFYQTEIEELEKTKAELQEDLKGRLKAEMKQRFYNQYADWYKKAKEKAEQELAQKVIEEMRKTALRQELVYSDLVNKLEEAYKENKRLGQELHKAQQRITQLKKNFNNHVKTVVKHASRGVLIKALKARPPEDRRAIINALKK